MNGLLIHHPYSGDVVEITEMKILASGKVRIKFKAKGQRGSFVISSDKQLEEAK